MAFTAGFSVNVGDPTKASDVDVLAANDDYLKNAIDTFIANDANNRVLTATGSGTANAETNLTFDGSTLTVTGTVSATTLSGNVTGGTISGTTGTFSGDVAVDSSVLKVDTANNRVGINVASPVAALNVYGNNYSPASGGQAVDGLVFRGGTAGDGTYTNGLSFSYGAGSAAIAGVQNGADSDTMGMAFFTHSSGTGSAAAEETMRLHSNGDLAVDTDTLFVDASADRVGIGTSSPTHPLTVAGPNTATNLGGTSALAIMDGNANNEFVNMKFQTSAGGNLAYIGAKGTTTGAYPNSVGELHFGIQNGSNTFTAMVIDSSQRVGISTSSPTHTLDVNGTAQIERNGGSPLLRFTDTSSSSRWIGIPDGSSRFAIYDTNGTTEEFVLYGGNVGINTTSPVEVSGYKHLTISDTSGGGLVCQYNGTSKLAVYSANNDGYYDAAVKHVFRTGGVFGGSTSMTLDSDGLKFGTDTAAANALDDYEEGTFSVGIAGSTTAGTVNVTSTAGYYTKIGNVVHAFGFVSWNSATGTGNLKLTGLPFTSSSSGQYYPAGSMTSANLTFSHTITPYVSLGSTFMQIQQSQSGAAGTFVQVDSTAEIYFNVTYFV